ncbi:MAG: hypothetical protein QXF26_05960, partial [Candidatus Bathyarchaeia archaeon]
MVNLAAIQMSPHHGIGRGFKVDKTQIVGLLKALQIFVNQDDKEEFNLRMKKANYLLEEFKKMSKVSEVDCIVPTEGYLRGWPTIRLRLKEKELGITMKEVVESL